MIAVGTEFHMWVTLALIAIGIGLYMVEKIPLELTSIGIVSVFLLFFQIFPMNAPDGHALISMRDLLAGFADPALIAILALLVIGQAIIQTGALDEATRLLVQFGIRHPRKVILFSFLTVMAISALLNNTPVVVVFIPIMSALAERLKRSPSILMMPLSFVAILGGMITLTGSSTNLLVTGSLEALTGIRLGFFEFSIPGLVLALSGGLYLLISAPRLLPDRNTAKEFLIAAGKQFIIQIGVTAESPLIGKKSIAGMFPDLEGMTIQLIQRGEHSFLPPF
jgi:di/tricarboxylate transporter